LSFVAATILLAYVLARFIELPERETTLQLFGVYFPFRLNVHTMVALIVAAITATGAEWFLRSHPALGSQSTWQRWLLPSLTAWVIRVPLIRLPSGPTWWLGLGLGGLLIFLVLLAEYIVIDPNDPRRMFAVPGLTALSYALFLMLAVSLRQWELRLIFLLAAMVPALFLIVLRSFRLRLGHWAVLPGVVVTLVIGQYTTALHYLPLSPLTFGLLVTTPAYGLTIFAESLVEGSSWKKAIWEPLLVVLLIWGGAQWMT
jgi:hypothetical protein